MRRLLSLIWSLLAVIGLITIIITAGMLRSGMTATGSPSAAETMVARAVRHRLVPSDARARTNPEPKTPEHDREGLEHWADHCASCHANDGSGETVMGQAFYPRVPDMRRADTQALSDGELFYIIEHGVKLTGMPAWGTGTPEGERQSWHLVQFIRRLPTLSPDEIAEMESLNPRSAAEWQAEDEARRFLSGEDPRPHEH